jgi:hypothetical protein
VDDSEKMKGEMEGKRKRLAEVAERRRREERRRGNNNQKEGKILGGKGGRNHWRLELGEL